MNWRPAAGLVVGGILVGWVFTKGCSRSGDEAKTPAPVMAPVVFEGEVKAAKDNPAGGVVGTGQQVASVQMREIQPIRKGELPFEYKKELELFADLKKRLFLSEPDLAEKRRLLSDTALLRALGLRLTEPSVAQAVVDSQDVAVDLLVEALKSGDRETASDVLKSVIEDAQVENPTMDRAVREHMAGVKGEIMLRWAALVPDQAARIEQSLPGPVSKKIWQNVKNRHESNRGESRDEAAGRSSN